MGTKITDRMVKSLALPAASYHITYDIDITGFGVRVTKAGTKSFVLAYASGGRERRYTIGKYPAWSVAAAREEASRLRLQVDTGGDPMGDRQAKRQERTVAELCKRYLEDYAVQKNRPATIARNTDYIDRFIKPHLGTLKVAAATYSDIDALHRRVTKENGPYIANRLAALCSKLFNLSIRWGWRTDNPAKGIERNQEAKRERYLSGPELRRLSKALAEYPWKEKVRLGRDEALRRGQRWAWQDRKTPLREREQSCNAIRLLMLTGARKSELLSATWDQFDLTNGVWTKPGANTKQKTMHRVPLSAPARQLLASMSADSKYVFPGRAGGHQQDIKSTWESMRELAEIPDVRIHDLRHTYAAQLASAGLSLPIIGALLGHTQAQTTARYSHLMDDPLRAATERVGRFLEEANADERGRGAGNA
ncbi:tyrosine-type recombinase/integrase [Salinisphaera sp. SWV1]|uniref:tyrosine-type recombinase/integrase n=1 Tax=Salinisphaera sp. SWV1 TaxID=3454139 RepID=UPI003F8429F5